MHSGERVIPRHCRCSAAPHALYNSLPAASMLLHHLCSRCCAAAAASASVESALANLQVVITKTRTRVKTRLTPMRGVCPFLSHALSPKQRSDAHPDREQVLIIHRPHSQRRMLNLPQLLEACNAWVPPLTSSARRTRCRLVEFSDDGTVENLAAVRRADVLVRVVRGLGTVQPCQVLGFVDTQRAGYADGDCFSMSTEHACKSVRSWMDWRSLCSCRA